MRYVILCVAFAVSGCATVAPRPSVWQMESECAAEHPLAEVEGCTRNYLNAEYDDAWHQAPAVDAFLDYIGVMAERVNSGAITEADGRLAVSNYAMQQLQSIQAAQAAQQAQQQAAIASLGEALLQNSGPCAVPHSPLTPCPAAPAAPSPPPPPITCRTVNNPYSGLTTTCQ